MTGEREITQAREEGEQGKQLLPQQNWTQCIVCYAGTQVHGRGRGLRRPGSIPAGPVVNQCDFSCEIFFSFRFS